MTHFPVHVLSCGLLLFLLAGCNKTETPPKPSTEAQNPASPSVAAPPQAMPPSDAATPPAGTAAPAQSSDQQSQANPAPMSGQQEKGGMPMAGQANDHSNLAAPQEQPKTEGSK